MIRHKYSLNQTKPNSTEPKQTKPIVYQFVPSCHPHTNSKFKIRFHKLDKTKITIKGLVWLKVLRNSCTVPYLFTCSAGKVICDKDSIGFVGSNWRIWLSYRFCFALHCITELDWIFVGSGNAGISFLIIIRFGCIKIVFVVWSKIG